LGRSSTTVAIEQRLKAGESLSSIARSVGVSRQRVHSIKVRLCQQLVNMTEPIDTQAGVLVSHLPMKSLTIQFTPAIHDALVEACAIVNRRDPEEPITIQEYIEELAINRVVELGLLRRNKRQ